MTTMPAMCALVATKSRYEQLASMSAPSIRQQTVLPQQVVVVDDGHDLDDTCVHALRRTLSAIPTTVIANTCVPGVAGAWNCGLRHLISSGFDGFVAILDDDDTWDSEHLAANLEVALRDTADVVVSGLRMLKDGEVVPRTLIAELSDRQFFTGNPGWQGSNTFAHIDAFKRVGGFRNGLASTNDRDLAIRLLRDPETLVSYTGRWTATWHFGTKGTQLSSRGTPAKLSGLRWFWHFYGANMTLEEADRFFSRSVEMFGFGMDEIMSPGPDLPRHRNMRGDLGAQ